MMKQLRLSGSGGQGDDQQPSLSLLKLVSEGKQAVQSQSMVQKHVVVLLKRK